MATRSNIAIILRPEDRDCNFNVMYKRFDTCRPNMQSPHCRNPKKEDWKDIFPNCYPGGKDVLEIYCHWDGYPESVGVALQSGYNTYEKALALILGGDLSEVKEDFSRPYSLGEGEDPEYCSPIALPDKPKMYEEYLYVFDYKTNQWYVQGKNTDYKPLTEVLK